MTRLDQHDDITDLLHSATPPEAAFVRSHDILHEGRRRHRRRATGRVAVVGAAAALVGALGLAAGTGFLPTSSGPDRDPAGSPSTSAVQDRPATIPGIDSPPQVAAVVPPGESGKQQIDVTIMHAGQGFKDTFQVRSGTSPASLGSPKTSGSVASFGYLADPDTQQCFSARLVRGKEHSPWSEPVCATTGDPSSSVPLDTRLHHTIVGLPPEGGAADERVSVVHEHLDAGEAGSLGLAPDDGGPREAFVVTTADGRTASFAVDPTSFAERGLLVTMGHQYVLVMPKGSELRALVDPARPGLDLLTSSDGGELPGTDLGVTVATLSESQPDVHPVAIWSDPTGALHASDGSAVYRAETADPSTGETLDLWAAPALSIVRAEGNTFGWQPQRVDNKDLPEALLSGVSLGNDGRLSDVSYVAAIPSGARSGPRLDYADNSNAGVAGSPVRLGTSGMDLYLIPVGNPAGTRLTLSWVDAEGATQSVAYVDSEVTQQ